MLSFMHKKHMMSQYGLIAKNIVIQTRKVTQSQQFNSASASIPSSNCEDTVSRQVREVGVVADPPSVVATVVIGGKTRLDGSSGPKHSVELRSGKFSHSRNGGHPTAVFSSTICSQPTRAASQRLRHGTIVVFSSVSPTFPQKGK